MARDLYDMRICIVILRLAVLIQYRRVTGKHTDAFYVRNCIFEHMTDKIFLVTGSP